MKSAAPCIAALLLSLSLTGCVYTDIRVPMSTEFRNTQTAKKTGTSSLRSVAWLVAWGDAGLQQAAANGQLSTLEYADHAFMNILFGLYMQRTTIVYGN
jgi:uncharacterized protein (DUF1684 family)